MIKSFCKQITVFAGLTASLLGAQGYRQVGAIDIGGAGGWDYLTVDSPSHRLYVSHETEVVVVDLGSNKVVGKITGLNRVHGIALAPDLDTGYISDGGANQVVFFSLARLQVTRRVAAGTNPDGIVFDAPSQRVFAFNGRSQNVTAINATTGAVDGTVALGGKPEFPVSDGKGSIYDNVEDKSEIVRIDSKTLQVQAHWSVAPCESPSGLAFDSTSRRLFSVCDNKTMAVVNADSGKVIASVPVGEGPDAAAFDEGTKVAFSSNGEDGTLTVIRQTGDHSYAVAETVPTMKSARTMALDPATHKIYLSTALFEPAKPGAGAHSRPPVVPGSFKVIVMGK